MKNILLARLGVIFGQPDHTDPVAYLAEMDRLLKKYTESQLDAGADLVLKTHRGRSWPTPAECVTGCEDAMQARFDTLPRAPIPNEHPQWTKQAIAVADRLIQCDLGQRAANEGWVLGLHDFCRKKARLPQLHEIAKIKVASKEFDHAYRMAQETGGAMGQSLVKLGATMLARRDRCARVTDGEVLP